MRESPPNRLVLATANRHKVEELRAILAPLGALDVRSLLDYPDFPKVEETEDTFEGNARQKALACARHTGLLSLADDSGIVVDALGGRPGVLSARYAPSGEEANRRLLAEMRAVPDGRRQARYVAVMALAWPDGRCVARTGTCEGEIARAPRGRGGFGYDPVFWLPDRGRMMAELAPEEKNAVSHRGRALEVILPILTEALRG
ncbi:MAG: RdgB/HAM1 family non-canonical purine NTP pyrophosphatase [Candidatus Sumerlaeota bacterium]|nr:RdgB/HAM1 family non-canonical purine NTP pyrophosphatase [Candidatus Sumerlaeota bacterium]